MREKRSVKSTGFTLVELMIVLAIIAVLSSVASVRYRSMLERSREGTTKGNAATLRIAIAIYYGDREGVWPTTLSAKDWKQYMMSIYLDTLPYVELSHGGWGVSPRGNAVSYLAPDGEPQIPGQGWAYDRTNGHLFVNSTYGDTLGLSYTTY